MKTVLVKPDISECRQQLRKFFPSLTNEEAASLIFPSDIEVYSKGKIIYEEGAHINSCYFIHQGIVKIFQTGSEGKEQIVKFDRDGDIFGFRSIIRREAACTSIETLSDTIVCQIPETKLSYLLKTNSGFAYQIMQLACKELGESNRYIRDIAQKSVKSRIAESLLLLSKEFGLESDGSMKIHISREDLGNFVGTATETVIRLLSDFKTDGLIDIKGRNIRLIAIDSLKKIANF